MKKRIVLTLLTLICTLCLAMGLIACADDSGLTLKTVTAQFAADGETLVALDFELSDGTEFTVVDAVYGGEGTTLESVTENYDENGGLETYTIALSNGMSFTIDASTTLTAIVPNLSGFTIESYTIILSGGDRFTVYVTTIEDNDEQGGQSGEDDAETELDLTETEGMYYEISNDGTYYILSGIGECTETDIVVPAEYSGLPVKEIRDWAFSSEEITSVVIHAGIEYIGESAFYGCENLAQIVVLDGNKNYKSVDGNLYTADGATLLQYALGNTAATFTIPSGVTTITDAALAESNYLTHVTIPEGIETISYLAFAYNTVLESVVIPSSVALVDGYAFANCANLKNIYYLGASMEQFAEIEIVDYDHDDEDNDYFVNATVFYYSESNVDSQYYQWTYDINGEIAIWYDNTSENDFEYTLAETKDYYLVLNIGTFAGYDIVIPETYKNLPVTGISDWAFSSEEITSIVLPVSVTEIWSNSFWGCESLTAIYYLGTSAQFESIEILTDEESYGTDYFAAATVYYYSESTPTESGNFWHYDSSGNIAIW